jgi:signal transduction histidine kinase
MLPLIVLSLNIYKTIEKQLIDQSLIKLDQECTGKRIEIYGKLLAVESELRLLGMKFKERTPFKSQQKYNFYSSALENPIQSVVVLKNKSQKIPLFNDIKNIPNLSDNEYAHINSGNSFISLAQENDNNSKVNIFMMQLVAKDEPNLGIIVAQVNPAYLTGEGDGDSRSETGQMLVCEKNKGCIINNTLPLKKAELTDILDQKPHPNRIEFSHDGEVYYGRSKSLFLKPRYFCPDFIIIMLEKKSSILGLVTNLIGNLFLIMVVTLLGALFLSMYLIRKSLVPLAKLKDGTRQISKGELGSQVVINSNDEFGDLAKSFNEMSKNLKEGRKILIQSSKMSALGEMSVGIIHEISQPLTSIFGYITLLENQSLTEKQLKYFKIIKAEYKRLEGIILKYRQFSHPSEIKLEYVSLNSVIEDTITLLSHQIDKKGIDISFHKDENIPYILGDQNSLKQVFINLIINAMDALENKRGPQRNIITWTYQNEDEVMVEVEDNGPGIPRELHDSIFDPFFTTKSIGKGSGLGLAIVNNMINQLNARLKLESQVGKGTKFILSFKIPRPLETSK